MSLTFEEAQARVAAWVSQYEEGYFPPLVQVSRLVEELGELARAIRHGTGGKNRKRDEGFQGGGGEVGDVGVGRGALGG